MPTNWMCIPERWLMYEQHEVRDSDMFGEVMTKETRLDGARAAAHCHWLLNSAGKLTPESVEADVVLCGLEHNRIMRMTPNVRDLGLAMARMVPLEVANRGDVRYAFQYGIELPGKWACEHIMRLRLQDALEFDLIGRNADVDADRLLAWHLGRRIWRSEDFAGVKDGKTIKIEEKSDHSEWDMTYSHFRPGYDAGHLILFTHFDGLGRKGWAVPDVAVIRTWLIPGDWISEKRNGEFRFELEDWYDDKLAHRVTHEALLAEQPMISECVVRAEDVERLRDAFVDEARGCGWRDLCQMMFDETAAARMMLRGLFGGPGRNLEFWRSKNKKYCGKTIRLSDSERQELWKLLCGSNSSETTD